MKGLFILAVATLFPLSACPLSATAAWADQPQAAPSVNQDATQTTGTIGAVGVERNPELVTPEARSQQLNQQAQQINQNLGTSANQNQQSAIRDLLNLPDGMIIRGSSRGGVGIGTEY